MEEVRKKIEKAPVSPSIKQDAIKMAEKMMNHEAYENPKSKGVNLREAFTMEEARKEIEEAPVSPTIKEDAIKMAEKMMNHEAYGNPNYKWSLDDFELGKKIGRGKFGRVYVSREKKTGFLVAIKTMLKKELVEEGVERQVMREIEIQSHLTHPNILQLLTWFHDSHRIYLVLEFAGKGELYHYLKNSPNGRFNENISAKYTYQVADALHYCHRKDVIHRDIKPENLLLTSSGDIKVADFGWSVRAPSLARKTMCGTTDYLPPEIVRGEEYRHYVDHWCLGVLLYEFLTGSPPFESPNTKSTFKKIANVNFEYPTYVSDGAKDLIDKLLVRNAASRLSLPGVMEHPWIQANK